MKKTNALTQSSKPGHHAIHQLDGNKCTLCLRSGAELETPCPGYTTAAEYVEWKKRTQPKGRKRA